MKTATCQKTRDGAHIVLRNVPLDVIPTGVGNWHIEHYPNGRRFLKIELLGGFP